MQQTVRLGQFKKQAVASSGGSFRSASGKDIFYRYWEPADPRAVLLLVHGLAEHCGRYDEFAGFLASAGIATYALDLPGHGKSGGKRGHIAKFGEYTGALGQLLALARQAHPDLPMVLLGHSMGGLIAADFLLRHQSEFVAAVLTGPAIRPPRQPSRLTLLVNKLLAGIVPTLGVLRLDATRVSRDPQVVENYDNDPLVFRGRVSARLVTELFAATNRVVANAAMIRLPLLIMHGSVDRLTGIEGSKLLHQAISSADRKIVIYDGLYHEILNEPERKLVMTDILQWLDPRINQAVHR